MRLKFVEALFYVVMGVMIAVVFAPIITAVLFPATVLAFLETVIQAV